MKTQRGTKIQGRDLGRMMFVCQVAEGNSLEQIYIYHITHWNFHSHILHAQKLNRWEFP